MNCSGRWRKRGKKETQFFSCALILFPAVSGWAFATEGAGAVFFGLGVEIDEFQGASADQSACRVEFLGTVADDAAGYFRTNGGQGASCALGGFLHGFYIGRAAQGT